MFHLANYSGVIQECFGGIDDGQRLMPLAFGPRDPTSPRYAELDNLDLQADWDADLTALRRDLR